MREVTTISGSKIFIHHYPDICPICHFSIQPKFVTCSISGNEEDESGNYLDIVLRCPRLQCGRIFIGVYYKSCNPPNRSEMGKWILQKAVPHHFKLPNISQEVESISPSFRLIYGQAEDAEHHGLDKVAGCGYRKALEFVVKDYCIYKHPQKTEEIKSKFLGKVIKEYIDEDKMKQCAERATWLGNDETHYERKWEGKDIEDLKTLIKLTCNWIESDLLTTNYKNEMQQ